MGGVLLFVGGELAGITGWNLLLVVLAEGGVLSVGGVCLRILATVSLEGGVLSLWLRCSSVLTGLNGGDRIALLSR